MQSFDQSLMRLYRGGLISYDEALKNSSQPTEFELRVKGVHASSDTTWDTFEEAPGASRSRARRRRSQAGGAGRRRARRIRGGADDLRAAGSRHGVDRLTKEGEPGPRGISRF